MSFFLSKVWSETTLSSNISANKSKSSSSKTPKSPKIPEVEVESESKTETENHHQSPRKRYSNVGGKILGFFGWKSSKQTAPK